MSDLSPHQTLRKSYCFARARGHTQQFSDDECWQRTKLLFVIIRLPFREWGGHIGQCAKLCLDLLKQNFIQLSCNMTPLETQQAVQTQSERCNAILWCMQILSSVRPVLTFPRPFRPCDRWRTRKQLCKMRMSRRRGEQALKRQRYFSIKPQHRYMASYCTHYKYRAYCLQWQCQDTVKVSL